MRSKTKTNKPTAASVTGVARTLSSLLHVPALETVVDVCERYESADETTDNQRKLIRDVVGLYPWTVNVTASIMGYHPVKNCDLVDHLRASIDEVFVVKSTQHAGKDAIWLAACLTNHTSSFMGAIGQNPGCRGIFHNVKTPEGSDLITAIQLSSCHF